MIPCKNEDNDGWIYYDAGFEKITRYALQCVHVYNDPEANYNAWLEDFIKNFLPTIANTKIRAAWNEFGSRVALWLKSDEESQKQIYKTLTGKDHIGGIQLGLESDTIKAIHDSHILFYATTSSSIPHPKVKQFFWSGLNLLLTLGYGIPLRKGITKKLKSKNNNLFDDLKKIWLDAMEHTHPFQRGPTHQGTRHCAQLLLNLNCLHKVFGITDEPEIGAMLSIAACLHDVGKADLIDQINEYHGIRGGKAVRNEPGAYSIPDECAIFVGTIIDCHAAEKDETTGNELNPIANLTGIHRFNPPSVTGHLIKRMDVGEDDMKLLCAIFQLADVLDTTSSRVSSPIISYLEEVHTSLPSSIDDVIKARENILRIEIKNKSDKINVIVNSKNPETDRRIKKENDDLIQTGAKDVLDKNDWPCELEIIIAP